jgi:hypothetical protein
MQMKHKYRALELNFFRKSENRDTYPSNACWETTKRKSVVVLDGGKSYDGQTDFLELTPSMYVYTYIQKHPDAELSVVGRNSSDCF